MDAAAPQRRSPTDTATVASSGEKFVQINPDVELCYDTLGDPRGRPLLMVMGLGGHLTWWPEALCAQLAEAGFYVIRYDNRDAGRSTKMSEHKVMRGDLLKAFSGRRVAVPYSIRDLARDGFELLDVLGIDKAHVAGISMGGMIAQTMALADSERVLSLTSIMSTTGSRRVGFTDPTLMPHLLHRAGRGREAYIAGSVQFWQRIASPLYLDSAADAAERAGRTYDRGISLSGIMRQMLAIVTQRDRTEALSTLHVPTTVLHGLSDRMVHHSGGRATAKAIPGAELMLVPGMGHDTPPKLFDTVASAILTSANRAVDRPPAN